MVSVSPKIGVSSVLLLLTMTGAFPDDVMKDNSVVISSPSAGVALGRFIAKQTLDSETPVETVEIEASLPKLNKSGRLRAIRRILPARHPEYQVLEISGDSMVNHELIVRYLHADQQAAEISGDSTAITPTNYKFRYVGVVQLRDVVAYAFRIIPHKKKQGLINGVLWIDGETGMAIRLSGYLVKNPSIFLKRVNLTRENCLRDGIVETRITHLLIDTRLVGSARLVVVERPTVSLENAQSVP